MADDTGQVNEANPVPQEGREFANRRTVVKGLVSAVPVIITVTSGEALANASSYQCITETPVYENTPECITKGKQDNWYRETRMVEGEDVEKECLVYVDSDGIPLHKVHGGKPLTHSCYNSFLPYK